jgi:hypothetical protein
LGDDPLFEADIGSHAELVEVADRDAVGAADDGAGEVRFGEVVANVGDYSGELGVGQDVLRVAVGLRAIVPGSLIGCSQLGAAESVGDADGMSDYALEVHYGDGEPPVRIDLPGYRAEEAETDRESLIQEIEHAVEIEAPLMYWAPTDSDAKAGVPIDPAKVTSVDLIETGQQ